ncbi:hypothetical protein FACS189451_04050 [Bacteroidia bacterium]|nr:hypothetical protein FACS189446_1850 [Bacteroidia bacterium]GHT61619.1 hypothetical protein FACS189451_04050 [Bacteroidia bacterium]
MKKEEAEILLKKNKLTLDGAGMEFLPMKTVQVSQFEITKAAYENAVGEMASLIGNLKAKDEGRGITCDFKCASFFVNLHHDYWYCDYFDDALIIINALRVVNDYNLSE